MKKQNSGKRRSDRPSGRQTSQPDNTTGGETSPESLHQGQGPDFVSQDKRMQEKNKGVRELDKNLGFQQAGKPQQPSDDSKTKEKLNERGEDLHDPEGDR
jgi:hypothetical protein